MLSVVPMMVEVADTALAKNRARLRTAGIHCETAPLSDNTTGRSGPSRPHHDHRVKRTNGNKRHDSIAQNDQSDDSNKEGEQKELLLCLLHQAKFLVSADTTGCMKQDMAALRLLLSPP